MNQGNIKQEGNIKKEPLEVELEALEEHFRQNVSNINAPGQEHYDREYASLFRTRENAKKNIYARYGKNYKKKRYVEFMNRNIIEYNNSYSNFPRPNEQQGFNVFENGANEEYNSNNFVPNNNSLKRNKPNNNFGNTNNNGNNGNNANKNNRRTRRHLTFPDPPSLSNLPNLSELPPNSQEGGKKGAKKTQRKQHKTQRKRR